MSGSFHEPACVCACAGASTASAPPYFGIAATSQKKHGLVPKIAPNQTVGNRLSFNSVNAFVLPPFFSNLGLFFAPTPFGTSFVLASTIRGHNELSSTLCFMFCDHRRRIHGCISFAIHG